MRLVPLDWLIVVASIVISFLPAILLAKRGGLAGTAADPSAPGTGLVARLAR
ncbi:MAG: hypothetical protein H0T48_02315 [Gemmatimonadaceae bacterium]|nr:hypothetical protein [Gemmatimonadaceae bacterium]